MAGEQSNEVPIQKMRRRMYFAVRKRTHFNRRHIRKRRCNNNIFLSPTFCTQSHTLTFSNISWMMHVSGMSHMFVNVFFGVF